MSEKREDIIRKSLDAVDREYNRSLWMGYPLLLLGIFFGSTMGLARNWYSQNLPMQLSWGFIAVIILNAAMTTFTMVALQRNTRMVLKAIETLSNQKSE